MPKGIGYTTDEEEKKAIKDAETVAAYAPDEKTKAEAAQVAATGEKPKPNPKVPVKSYDIASLKQNPLESKDEKIAKQRKEEFDKLNEEEKKKYVIKAKVLENQHLDKAEQHELSREDMVFAGLMTA